MLKIQKQGILEPEYSNEKKGIDIDMLYQYAINIGEITNTAQLKDLMNDLSKERVVRVNKYYFERDKIRCITAEILLRYILQKQFGLENNQIKFQYSPYGKPFLAFGENIYFNLSHSGDWVVCAVDNYPIGVDIEKNKELHLPHLYSFFSKKEIQLLHDTSKDEQTDLFYRIWTLKESFVKNIGKGLNYSFNKFYFDFNDNKIRFFQNDIVNNDFQFISLKLDEFHWYALCTKCNQHDITNKMKIVTIKDFFEIAK